MLKVMFVSCDTKKGAMMGIIYGYCRISRNTQNIERQERNIKAAFPTAVIRKEAYTGTKIDRPVWNNLLSNLKKGDSIVFDSVSRMSRNAEEGVKAYFDLYDKGINLIFLKEHYIDTYVYKNNQKDRIELTGTIVDEIYMGINNYFRKLAEKQIRIAFEQAEKEVADLRQRTKEGIVTARLNGKQIGQPKGKKQTTKKSIKAKEIILKHSRDFNGSLTDEEVMKLAGISRNSLYKYKREMREANDS